MQRVTSSFRANFSITTPAIPPFSKDTMKEGAMCLGYFYLLNSSVVERRAVNPKAEVRSLFQWAPPTQYHLLFKTYKQAAMHWVTSVTCFGFIVHPCDSRLLFKRNNYNRRLCVDLLLCMGHLCRGFDSCPPGYRNKPREVAQLVEQSIFSRTISVCCFFNN